jgi:hypothetical protein
MTHTLFVDDNFHYMDEDERYQAGEFDSWEEAVEKAESIVDEFLSSSYKKGMTAEELYKHYISFGEDPFITGGSPETTFSAWEYAKKRCDEICRDKDM